MPVFDQVGLTDLDRVAAAMVRDIPLGSVLLLVGDLGAGKTTLTAAIARLLGATTLVSSPTYAIINHYGLPDGELYHIDLYRLQDIDQAIDIGIADYLYPSYYTIIEWPQLIEEILPLEHCWQVNIEATGSRRRVSYNALG